MDCAELLVRDDDVVIGRSLGSIGLVFLAFTHFTSSVISRTLPKLPSTFTQELHGQSSHSGGWGEALGHSLFPGLEVLN